MPRRKQILTPTEAQARAPKTKIGIEDMIKIMPFLDDEIIARVILGSNDFQSAIEPFVETKTDEGYPTDPVEFMTDVLGYQVWDKLKNICNSVENNHNTVVSSSFGIGKSITASSLVCWWMCRWDDAVVILIAPTFAQVQNIVFRYVRNVGRKANLPGYILDSPRWEISPNHYAIGLSPRRSNAEDITSLQGYHSPHLLVVMDEAAGLPRIIWDSVAGLAASDTSRIVAIANPIEQSGPFWDACNSHNWHHISISAFHHPNVIAGEEIIPGAVTRRWIEERADEWATEVTVGTPGAIHLPWVDRWYLPQPIFYAKVMGIAPEQADDQLIRLSWVVEAQERIVDIKNSEMVAGLDPARKGGDTSVLLLRYGHRVVGIKRYNGLDLKQLTDRVGNELRELGAIKCYVDEAGLGGGVLDYGRRIGLPFVGVNFARSALQKRRFANLRAECWWRVRELLREGKLQIPNDSLLAGDLTAPKYGADQYQRILLESKDEIRDRIKRSPDTGDALALSYATPIADMDDDTMKELMGLGGKHNETDTLVVKKWDIEQIAPSVRRIGHK